MKQLSTLSTTARLLLILAVLGVILLPIAFYPLGIVNDYINQLARVYIYAAFDGEPLLQENYRQVSIILPHVGMDFAVGWLVPLIGAYAAGQVFIGLTLVLLASSSFALNWALYRKFSLWPLFAVLTLYSLPLEWGFVDFLFSGALAVHFFALWIYSEDWKPRWRIPLFVFLNLPLFFAHILGFLFFGLLLGAYELGLFIYSKPRRIGFTLVAWAAKFSQFLFPLALVAISASSWSQDNSRLITRYGGFGEKAQNLLSPGLFYGEAIFAAIIVSLFCIVLAHGRRSKNLVWDRRAFVPLAAVTLLVIVTPRWAGNVWGIDFRFPFLFFLMLAATAEFKGSGKIGRRLSLVFLAGLLVQQANAHYQMRLIDREQQELRVAFALLAPGSALLTVATGDVDCWDCSPHWRRIRHSPTLAAVERQVFVPELFSPLSLVRPSEKRLPLDVPKSWPLPEPLVLRDKDKDPPAPNLTYNVNHPYWQGWPKTFDYVLWLNEGGESMTPLSELELMHRGSYFELYRVVKEATASSEGATVD